MTEDPPQTVPSLRFPEFVDSPAWQHATIQGTAPLVNERVPVEQIQLTDYVSTENLLPDFGGVSPATRLPPTGSATRYQPDDILLANIRPYLRKAWRSNRFGGASNDVIVMRPSRGVDPRFFEHVVKNDAFIAYVMKTAKGVKMPRGDLDSIRDYAVYRPAREEQQKIADCLCWLDDLIAAEGRKLEALRRHKQGLMQQLFPQPGETVPRLRFPEFKDSENWTEQTLDQIAKFQSGGTPSKANPMYWQGSIPWVSAKDMKQLVLDDSEDHITDAAVEDSAKLAPAGTVLILTRGMTLLRDIPICLLARPMSFNQDVRALRPKDGFDGRFLAFMLLGNKQRIRRMVDIAGHGTGRLNTDKLKALDVLFPSNSEQQRIADCLSFLDDQLSAQSTKIETLKRHKQALLQRLFPSLEGD